MTHPLESYEQAIEFLFSRINYERVSGGYDGGDLKLERMQWLLELLGNPQHETPVVHVGGTKGKGSTASIIAAALTAADYRTGLFTSPHISAFEERMTVDGVRPTPAELVALVNRVQGAVDEIDRAPGRMFPTYFEIATALAWLYFADCQAQVAVLEVGLGGRLDSTNLCHPELTVITNVSRDHMHILGSTVAEIAAEKAGIIKPGVPVVTGIDDPQALAVVAEVCRRQRAPLTVASRDVRWRLRPGDAGEAWVDVETPWRRWTRAAVRLPGKHQAANAALALTALDRLDDAGRPVPQAAAYRALQTVNWPARIEQLGERPTVIVDTAHNWESIRALLATLETQFPARRRLLVFAATRDKDVRGMLRQLLAAFDSVILTRFLDNPRSVPCDELDRLVRTISGQPVHVTADPAAAWKLASRLAGEQDLICATGSFFLAAEMRELILDRRRIGAATDDRPAPA